MRLDTECDVSIDARRHAGDEISRRIADIRSDLLAEHLGVTAERFKTVYDETGSLIAAIEQLLGTGRSLRAYECPDLNETEAWIADNEVLDPEDPNELFEPFSKRGLFRWLSPPSE